MKLLAMILAVPLVGALARAEAPSPPPAPILEAYPDDIQASLEARDRRLRKIEPPPGATISSIVEDALRWYPGQVVTVAFCGGTTELHRQIAEAAIEWTRHGNLILDFGLDEATGKFREWSVGDKAYAANIRIAFDGGEYWSLVGLTSIDPTVVPPNRASMKLGGFAKQLPADWRATVLHEFGHALGFYHEHQNPRGGCEPEFRWEDDPGYPETPGSRPGIYTWLGAKPNWWPKWKVDANLRELESSSRYMLSEHDPESIMHYRFPAFMFVRGEKSQCCVGPNTDLSKGDVDAMALAYPFADEQAMELIFRRIADLRVLLASEQVDRHDAARYETQLKMLQTVE